MLCGCILSMAVRDWLPKSTTRVSHRYLARHVPLINGYKLLNTRFMRLDLGATGRQRFDKFTKLFQLSCYKSLKSRRKQKIGCFRRNIAIIRRYFLFNFSI